MSEEAFLVDLYELTMLQAYWREGLDGPAVFELFARRLPPERNFLLAAGLEQALDYLEGLAFSSSQLSWLEGLGGFERGFLDWLSRLRFRGDVDALPEGTAAFADEPLLRVTAPLPQAQLVETRLLNIVNFQTAVASKAARCALAARGRRLVEFGLRRAPGGEAGVWAARAAYLAGFHGTSNVLAGRRFGIPLSGTMAHSFVQAHDGEPQAFAAFARGNPRRCVLLLDTYDVDNAAAEAAWLGAGLKRSGIPLRGVRLDSGDLAAQARRVRAVLDQAGLSSTEIFASGNLDEWALRELVAGGAPIDGFGVGTKLSTSSDAPSLDCVYKLEEYVGRPRRKRSAGKATWPGRKQVWRRRDAGGLLLGDVVGLAGEAQDGEALLLPAMRAGRRLARPPLDEARRRAAGQLAALPNGLRALEPAPPYPVRISETIRRLAERLDRGRLAEEALSP